MVRQSCVDVASGGSNYILQKGALSQVEEWKKVRGRGRGKSKSAPGRNIKMIKLRCPHPTILSP